MHAIIRSLLIRFAGDESWSQVPESQCSVESCGNPLNSEQLMAAIKQDVKNMQARGNYGDGKSTPPASEHIAERTAGFWSDGQRLRDSAKMGAEGLSESNGYVLHLAQADLRLAGPSDFPEYVCGVTAG